MKLTLPRNSPRVRPAFTLVEVLVVIFIMIALAAMAFLGSNKMTAVAGKSVSLENLRKLQIANASYAAGNNGGFVATYTKDESGKTGGLWDRNPDFLDIYLGDDTPPSDGKQESRIEPKHLDPIAYKARAKGYDTLKANYGMISRISYNGSGPDTNSSYRIGDLTAPSQTAAFVTAVNWLVQYGGRYNWKGVEGKVNSPMIAYRHKDKALVVYYDGHVGEVSKEDMKRLDRRGGKKNSFWTGNNGTP